MTGFKQVAAARGGVWLQRGWQLLRAEPRLWLAMAAVYLALAVVLELIPFIGRLILVLFTPLMLLGALPVAAALAGKGLPARSLPATPAGGGLGGRLHYLRALFGTGAQRLFDGVRDDEKLMPIMVVSTLVLGGLVLIQILAQLLKANPAALADTLASGVSSSVWISAVLGMVIVLALDVLLVLAVLYAVPLILFRGDHPLPAIAASFRAATANLGAVALFGGTFVIISVVSRVLFHKLSFPLDYLVFVGIGLVALPVFVAGLYASYLELFTNKAH
jgi:uncharacterized membrane protein